MFRSGHFVASQIESVSDAQIQPNGVDLTLGDVLEQVEAGRVGVDGKTVGDREPVESDADGFDLDPGGYILQYAETISIPEDHVGFLYPRSTLMRNSCMLNTAVWDAGYEGKGEGLLQVHHPIRLERGARIAQLVLAEAGHEDVYAGTYQGERTDEEP
ncbi:deoxyuridine 5'-triphosphate nucleotidohydrolase [Halobellus litoreus]|uniref:Deoxyuridine 5'-triphosphate nucleotidohydrolase n=1 Tax=Halobellus litoreus TaxID=755310 RepID=A0ABD6DV98_9EURY|nr:deoxyuridine 5'-triphosphate nucleotidohydrolase [Halobellus litoreus]